MGTIRQGAERAVGEYLGIGPHHRVVILTDRKCASLAKAVQDAAKKRTEDIHLFDMDNYKKRKKRKKFPKKIRATYENTSKRVISFYLARDGLGTNKGRLRDLGDPIADIVDKGQANHIKHITVPGVSRQVMQQGFCVPLSLIKKYTTRVYKRIREIKRVEVYSPGGTSLQLSVDPKEVGWRKEDHVNFGDCENIPFGEIYTSPITCEGTLVVDLLLGGGYESKYDTKFLRENPLTFKIKKGKVTKFSCKRKKRVVGRLEEDLFDGGRASNAIGELGFGTNFGLKGIIGNMVQDEKIPGVHIAIGASEPYCGKKWNASKHIDVMMMNPSVFVDGRLLIREGKYVFRDGVYKPKS